MNRAVNNRVKKLEAILKPITLVTVLYKDGRERTLALDEALEAMKNDNAYHLHIELSPDERRRLLELRKLEATEYIKEMVEARDDYQQHGGRCTQIIYASKPYEVVTPEEDEDGFYTHYYIFPNGERIHNANMQEEAYKRGIGFLIVKDYDTYKQSWRNHAPCYTNGIMPEEVKRRNAEITAAAKAKKR